MTWRPKTEKWASIRKKNWMLFFVLSFLKKRLIDCQENIQYSCGPLVISRKKWNFWVDGGKWFLYSWSLFSFPKGGRAELWDFTWKNEAPSFSQHMWYRHNIESPVLSNKQCLLHMLVNLCQTVFDPVSKLFWKAFKNGIKRCCLAPLL